MTLKKVLYFLLIFGPVAFVGRLLGMSPVLVLVFAALGVIPLADLIGEATEELAAHTGPRLGGLLNAALGNTAELIITIFALREGLQPFVSGLRPLLSPLACGLFPLASLRI